MAIPKLETEYILKALQYIDKNGVPPPHQSIKYELVTDEQKRYPPKYVIAIANHLANNTAISTDTFNAIEAKNYLKSQGFTIEAIQQENFKLTITAEGIMSTDKRFTVDNLHLGDNYKPLDAYFQRATGEVIKRTYSKSEKRNSNQTLPHIACQIFEKQLTTLS